MSEPSKHPARSSNHHVCSMPRSETPSHLQRFTRPSSGRSGRSDLGQQRLAHVALSPGLQPAVVDENGLLRELLLKHVEEEDEHTEEEEKRLAPEAEHRQLAHVEELLLPLPAVGQVLDDGAQGHDHLHEADLAVAIQVHSLHGRLLDVREDLRDADRAVAVAVEQLHLVAQQLIQRNQLAHGPHRVGAREDADVRSDLAHCQQLDGFAQRDPPFGRELLVRHEDLPLHVVSQEHILHRRQAGLQLVVDARHLVVDEAVAHVR
mmetsp:Transcript_29824/g.70886  ORF Transcript_29824/g.70886 Transcript_29824/m.70886 type:complete len:263 (+) Transcript_29824:45-833(+)